MTDKKPDEGEKTEEAKTDGQDPLKFGELKDMITSVVSDAVKSIVGAEDKAQGKAQEHTERRLDRSSTIEDEVKTQLARIEEQEAKKRKEDERDGLIQQLKAKVIDDKPPIERRRIHRIMGWGEPN